MNVCSIQRVGILAMLGCLATTSVFDTRALAIDKLKVGEAFPDFSLARADGVQGVYSASQLKGKPTAVVMWRPKQELSLEALRDLKAISEEIGAERILVVAVDTARSTAQAIGEALAGEALPFPVLGDPKRELYEAVGVIVSPTTLVLDERGVLRFVLASHPRTFRQVIRARFRYLLGEIDQDEMKREVEPTVLKIDQDLAAAWRMYNLGRRLQAEGKSKEALAVFEDTVSRYPSLAEARCALGFIKLSEGDLRSAAKQFQAALTQDPKSPLARLGKAVVLIRISQTEKAEPILLSLLGQESVAARVRYELGRIYQARGQVDRAVTFYRDALSVVFPEHAGGAERGEGALQAHGTARRSQSAPPPRGAPRTAAPVPSSRVAASAPGSVAVRGSALTGAKPSTAPRKDVTPVVPPADARYLGIMGCKKCHFQQWKSWQDTKMASAIELLKPGVRSDEKAARNLDSRKDYRADAACLACHTTGYGLPGGYPKDASGASASATKHLGSVGCEACHGPGDKYVSIHKNVQDKQRKYSQDELFDAGQYRIDERVCASCHNSKGPCIAPGKVFDFATRKQEGTHKHYQLKFRS